MVKITSIKELKMPYIIQEQKKKIDPFINRRLFNELSLDKEGEYNYIITSLLYRTVSRKPTSFRSGMN